MKAEDFQSVDIMKWQAAAENLGSLCLLVKDVKTHIWWGIVVPKGTEKQIIM